MKRGRGEAQEQVILDKERRGNAKQSDHVGKKMVSLLQPASPIFSRDVVELLLLRSAPVGLSLCRSLCVCVCVCV